MKSTQTFSVILYRYFMKQCQQFSNLSSNTKGIWTVILLIYSHIIYTSLSVLNCPLIPQKDGKKSNRVSHRTWNIRFYLIIEYGLLNILCCFIVLTQRWYFSGETECFTSTSHLWLTILSLFVLLLSILLIPVIISITYISKRAKVYLIWMINISITA